MIDDGRNGTKLTAYGASHADYSSVPFSWHRELKLLALSGEVFEAGTMGSSGCIRHVSVTDRRGGLSCLVDGMHSFVNLTECEGSNGWNVWKVYAHRKVLLYNS